MCQHSSIGYPAEQIISRVSKVARVLCDCVVHSHRDEGKIVEVHVCVPLIVNHRLNNVTL